MADELNDIKQNVIIDVKETGADKAAANMDELQVSISDTTEASKKQNAESKKTEEGFKTLKVQLKEAIVLQQQLAAKYGTTSAEATKAAKAVAEIKDEIGFQKDLVDSYNPDDKFRKLTQTAAISALALGGVKDGLKAVGIESETLDKVIGTAESILGVTGAIGGLTDAYEILTATKKAKSAADVVEIGTTEALAVAEAEATTATWSWNASLLANPIVLIAAAVVAAGVAIYSYIKITGDAVKAEEKLKMQTMQLNREIENQNTSFDKTSKALSSYNKFQLDLAKAAGKSASEIRNLESAFAEQEVSAARRNEDVARKILEQAGGTGKENIEKAIANLEKAQKIREEAQDRQIETIKKHEVEIVQIETDARNKALEAQKAANEKIREEEKRHREQLLADKKKFDEETAKGIEEMNVAKAHADEDARVLESEQRQADIDATNKFAEEEQQKLYDAEKKSEDARLELKKYVKEKEVDIAESALSLFSTLAGKNKKLQKAALIAEGGLSVAKTVQNTFTGNAAALAQGIAQAGPVAGPAVAAPAIVLNSVQGALSVAGTIAATAKGLSAIGEGGGISGGGNATGAGGGSPSRNVAQVGFQASSENQISTAVKQQQKDQPPIQAYVVSQSVTDQQELDRKKELNNSF